MIDKGERMVLKKIGSDRGGKMTHCNFFGARYCVNRDYE